MAERNATPRGGTTAAPAKSADRLVVTIEKKGDVATLALTGWFDIENLRRVESALLELTDGGAKVIAVDCRHLDGIDSSAIGSLVKFFNYAMLRHVNLVICDLNQSLAKLFHVAKLDRYFTLMSSDEFARRYVGGEASATTC